MSSINWTILTGIFGFIVAVLLIAIRAGFILKDFSSSAKTTLHDDVKVPVNNVKDRVAALNKQLSEFIAREKEDHRNLLKIMTKSSKSHRELLTMMQKLDNDHQEIKSHRHKLDLQRAKLDQHDKDISWLEKNKADKIKRNRGKIK